MAPLTCFQMLMMMLKIVMIKMMMRMTMIEIMISMKMTDDEEAEAPLIHLMTPSGSHFS